MHNYREEVWTVVSGKGKAIVDGMEQVLRTGDVITIAAGCKHTVEAITALDRFRDCCCTVYRHSLELKWNFQDILE